ncbi:MAG: hypothetical protein COA74_05125 [Gammaproteobacteria bacterium]|nr:MAG: hypothetical protein COA74_05125 [Gammaproteobacteria bacterium]
MRVDWQIKPSATFHVIVFSIVLLPMGSSIATSESLVYASITTLMSLVLLRLLLKENQDVTAKLLNNLSWRDGNWFYTNETREIEGRLAKQSFNLGLVLLLIIEDQQGQVVKLWLFPDSFYNISNSSLGWRHLNSCFYLSD